MVIDTMDLVLSYCQDQPQPQLSWANLIVRIMGKHHTTTQPPLALS